MLYECEKLKVPTPVYYTTKDAIKNIHRIVLYERSFQVTFCLIVTQMN